MALWGVGCGMQKQKAHHPYAVKELDYVLTPGLYEGLAKQEDDFDFSERFSQLLMRLLIMRYAIAGHAAKRPTRM